MLIVATVASTIRSFLIPYATHFRAAGWRVDAAAKGASTDPQVLDAFDTTFDIPISRSVKDVRSMFASYEEIATAVARGYDIVHVHTPIAAFLTRLAVRRMPSGSRPAVVYTAHGFHFHAGGARLTNLVFLTAEKVSGRWTDRLIVINSEDAAAAVRHHLVPRSHLVHLPGIGIDTAWFARSSVDAAAIAHVRSELGIASDAPMFVVVAEMNRNKRPVDVAEAAALMRQPAHVVFLGDGPERVAVEASVRRNGLGDKVHIQGFVPDVRAVVAASTALVLASSREGLPRSIMEALSLQVPVIATNARGSGDLVLPDGGLVVPVGDVRALASAMDTLAGEAALRTAMGRAGRERMVARYDTTLLIGAHERLYDDLLRERSMRSGG